MPIPKLTDIELDNKRVIVRADLDFDSKDTNNLRLLTLTPTLDFLKERNCNIVIIGHRGRPGGKPSDDLSLSQFGNYFSKWGAQLLENLRFESGEEENDMEFAKRLASHGEAFVNDAFGVSHRQHASIVSLPKLLPHAAGIHFQEEVNNLGRVLSGAQHPVTVIISGVKDDKLSYVEEFKLFADKILIGGRMPDYIHDTSALRSDPKLIVAGLLPDKEDITINSIEKFEAVIREAGTIVVSGPIGKYEEEGHRQGTSRVFGAVVNSQAFKVAGGGDTISALNLLGLTDKFDWVSTGGGAMLEFLGSGTLPGIEALKLS
jgi:phosphoglycerate kinase